MVRASAYVKRDLSQVVQELREELDENERRLGDNPDDVKALTRLAELHRMRRDPQSGEPYLHLPVPDRDKMTRLLDALRDVMTG